MPAVRHPQKLYGIPSEHARIQEAQDQAIRDLSAKRETKYMTATKDADAAVNTVVALTAFGGALNEDVRVVGLWITPSGDVASTGSSNYKTLSVYMARKPGEHTPIASVSTAARALPSGKQEKIAALDLTARQGTSFLFDVKKTGTGGARLPRLTIALGYQIGG